MRDTVQTELIHDPERGSEAATSGEASGPPADGAPGVARLPVRARPYLDVRSAVETVASAGGLALAASMITVGTIRLVLLALIGVLLIVGLMLELPVLNRLKMAHTSYSVTPHYIYIARGRVFRRTVTLASQKVLNVESVQGPLLRRFDLVKVRFTCLADVVSLGPLTPATADHVRETVIGAQRTVSRG